MSDGILHIMQYLVWQSNETHLMKFTLEINAFVAHTKQTESRWFDEQSA
jgi:hypothetical protein